MSRLIVIEGHEGQRRQLAEQLAALSKKGFALAGKLEASTAFRDWKELFASAGARGLFDARTVTVAEGAEGIVFLHQVVPRPADRSYGIEVARLAGLPKPVLRRAFELLELFEREGFERSSIPEPLPQNALRRQLLLFSPETDAVVEELAELDLDNLTPMRAMEVLYSMKEKSMRARDGATD